MAAKTGSLSINSENIFPIIKKWLYSDHDIFYRELISNGCDAITKLKKLALMGEYEEPGDTEYKIQVTVNSEDKTITVEDNGIGMTAEEVEEYINQIAFSGAQNFLAKYKDKANEDQIIGHFGLGFYSAFMVADKVTIDTLSYKKDAEPVHWESEGGTEFAMDKGDKEGNGTKIVLYLNEDSTEFCNEYRAREVIQKYCSFMPVEIYLKNATAEPEYETIEKDQLTDKDTIVETVVEEAKTEEKEKEDGTKETVEVSPRTEKYKILKRPVALNDIHPLWNKHPNECTEEEYKEFYRKVFMDYKEPLFWIHLNMDYPFNLKGILYFPKINMEYESIEGTIKLYNNQVFIADNIKEVIPEFLMLLKGVIDCPDLPLNVSRSALQNDGSKSRSHINPGRCRGFCAPRPPEIRTKLPSCSTAPEVLLPHSDIIFLRSNPSRCRDGGLKWRVFRFHPEVPKNLRSSQYHRSASRPGERLRDSFSHSLQLSFVFSPFFFTHIYPHKHTDVPFSTIPRSRQSGIFPCRAQIQSRPL